MGRKKIYTEEELKDIQRERSRKYYYEHKKERIEKSKEWQSKNRDKVKEYVKKASLKWYYNNIEKARELSREYYLNHKEEKREYCNSYRKTPMGRASYLRSAYIKEDEKYNRGKCDLTAEWIVEHIFSQPCAHCGKTGWDVIGCNRLDNSKPHTKDNVEPCCFECNIKLANE